MSLNVCIYIFLHLKIVINDTIKEPISFKITIICFLSFMDELWQSIKWYTYGFEEVRETRILGRNYLIFDFRNDKILLQVELLSYNYFMHCEKNKSFLPYFQWIVAEFIAIMNLIVNLKISVFKNLSWCNSFLMVAFI